MKNKAGLLFVVLMLVGIAPIEAAKSGTEITSDRVEMEPEGDYNIFKFYGNVHMVGDDMDAVCDELEVISRKNEEGKTAAMDDSDSIKKIIAKGNVVMEQVERTITAGHAEIYPGEGKVILAKNPVVLNKKNGTVVKGHRIAFYKNDGKAYVEGGGTNGERPKIILPGMSGLSKNSGQKDKKIARVRTEDLTGSRR